MLLTASRHSADIGLPYVPYVIFKPMYSSERNWLTAQLTRTVD